MITIKVQKKEFETIEIQTPFYYCHDLTEENTYICYGRIDENKVVTITQTQNGNETSYELSVNEINNFDSYHSYIDEYYKSTKTEFDLAMIRFKKFIDRVTQ